MCDFLTLQEANGDGQPLWREESSLSLCFKVKEKTEWNRPAGYAVMCVGLKERRALSRLELKITSFPTVTLSHEFSTSSTTPSSPPSYTQQLFKRSTTGYIQYRYECLETRTKKKKKKSHIKDGTMFHVVVQNDTATLLACVSRLWFFAEQGSSWTHPWCRHFWPYQLLTQSSTKHETFSSKTHFQKTKLGMYTGIKIRGREQIMAIIQCGVWRQLFGSIWTCRITYLCV